MKMRDIVGMVCPSCENTLDAVQFGKVMQRFEDLLTDDMDPLRLQMKCQSCDHIGHAREFVKTLKGAMFVWGERIEAGE